MLSHGHGHATPGRHAVGLWGNPVSGVTGTRVQIGAVIGQVIGSVIAAAPASARGSHVGSGYGPFADCRGLQREHAGFGVRAYLFTGTGLDTTSTMVWLTIRRRQIPARLQWGEVRVRDEKQGRSIH